MVGNKNLTPQSDGVTATWQYTLGSVVFFYVVFNAFLVMDLLESVRANGMILPLILIGLVLISAVLQVRFSWFLRDGLGNGLPRLAWLVALAIPSGIAWIIAFLDFRFVMVAVLPLWLSASILFCLVPQRLRWHLLGGTLALCALPVVVHALAGNFEINPDTQVRDVMFVIYALTLPFMVLFSMWWWNIVKRLDHSRQVAAELAVTQERLRFAADLHDIQGHHLQVIALKSELAERLMDKDPQQAALYLGEVRSIAKEAMEETRSLVAGLREVSLVDEVANAAEVLELTGATCTVSIDPLPHKQDLHRVLALAVREATTNILRHATAGHVQISLTSTTPSVVLQISNNGLNPNSTDAPDRSSSTGIAGLRSRAEKLGGTLVTTTDLQTDRFTLTLSIPRTTEGTA